MSCEQANADTLKKFGHRLTPQRLMILTAVRHAGAHVTASDVVAEVKESYPYIDISTVYRTLGALKQLRLVSETDMDGGESSYEWIERQSHHPLLCRTYDRVTPCATKHAASATCGLPCPPAAQSSLCRR